MGRARLITAGILLILGIALLANRWGSTRIEIIPEISAVELRALRGRPKAIATRASVDWGRRRYRARSRDAFYAADPRTVTSVADATELLGRATELSGRLVRVASVPPARTYFYEVRRHVRTARDEPTATSLYVPVEGMNGAVWIVSERLAGKDDPKGNIFLARPAHTGKVVSLLDVYDGTLLTQMVGKTGAAASAIALDTEEPLPTSEPVDTWAPLTGADDDVWVVFDGAPSAPSAVGGVAERVTDPALDALASRGRGLEHKGRTVVWVGEVDTFRARHVQDGRVSWFGLILALLGAVMLAGHVLLARA